MISNKYLAFLEGDNAYTVITNKNIKDSSSCVVVKESFGNALVPYLTDHFSKIYVIDYRYWNGKLSHLVKDKKILKIFFINNISMTRNSYLVGKLNQQIRWSLYGNKAEERITMVFSSVVFLFLFLREGIITKELSLQLDIDRCIIIT